MKSLKTDIEYPSSLRKVKVLVLTMYCGEPQIDCCIASVENQEEVTCTHKLIVDKPNVEAHRELYSIINNDDQHDFYIKLDADMEFSSNRSLISLISLFEDNVDYITLPVFDFMTNSDIPALHIYSKNVSIDLGKLDELYVDNVKVLYPGRRRHITDSRMLVHHSRAPSTSQAYAFGVHRAMKICQYDRKIVNLGAAFYQLDIIHKVHKNFVRNPDFSALEFVLTGAVHVIHRKHDGVMGNKVEYLNDDSVHQVPSGSFKIFTKNRFIAVLNILGRKRFLVGLFYYVIYKIAKIPYKIYSIVRGFMRANSYKQG